MSPCTAALRGPDQLDTPLHSAGQHDKAAAGGRSAACQDSAYDGMLLSAGADGKVVGWQLTAG
jgi:hypothetical protein